MRRFLSGAMTSAAVLAAAGFGWVEVTRGATEREHVRDEGRTDENPYSNAVLVGDTLYLAGDIGLDPETGAPPPEIEAEVRIVMENMKARLERAGMTMDDLVMVEVFCPDLSLYGEFNAVYRTYFEGDFPARAFIGSGPLLGGGHFEVTGVAVRR